MIRIFGSISTQSFSEYFALQGIKKNNYKDRLEAAGVLLIPKDQLSLQRRIALGRPYSGDVYLATWTRHDDTKVCNDFGKNCFYSQLTLLLPG